MAKMYDLCLFGPDDPSLWLAAAAAANQGLRVALLLDPLPDPELPVFPHLPLNPARLRPVAAQFGFQPAPSPFPAYLPELQVIVAGKTLDFVADPAFNQSALERDFQDRAAPFAARAAELEKWADSALTAAREQNFPGEPPAPENPPVWRKWVKQKRWSPEPSPHWSQWAEALTSAERAVFTACATAWLGYPLPPDAETLLVALAWKMTRSLHHGDGDDNDVRDTCAAKVSKRGAVIEAGAEAVTERGSESHLIRLRGGTTIETQGVMGPSAALYRLYGERRESPGALTLRRTFFLKIDRATIPDTLAPRVLVVADPGRSTSGDNLLLLARAPRAPRRETLAVTMYHPPSSLKTEDIPGLLAAALPWLNPKLVTPDETRDPVSVTIRPPRGLQRAGEAPVMPPANIFCLPGEALPSWGLWGTMLSARQELPGLK